MVQMTHQLLFTFSLFLLLASWRVGTATSDELLTTFESTTFNDFIHLTPDIIYFTTPDPPNIDTKPTFFPKLTENGRPQAGDHQSYATKLSPKHHAKNEAQDPIIRNERSISPPGTLKPRRATCRKKSPTTVRAGFSTFLETATGTSKMPVTSRISKTTYPKTSSTKRILPKTTYTSHVESSFTSASPKIIDTSHRGMRTTFMTTTVSYHESLGVSERTTTHLDKTIVNVSKASERTSLSQISNTSHEGTGTSDKTTTVSPNSITRYHEGMEVSDRTTLHLDKTIDNIPKDSGASERTTSLSQITNTSPGGIGASDRTSSVLSNTITSYHEGIEISAKTIPHLDKTIGNTPEYTEALEKTFLSQITSTSYESTETSKRTTSDHKDLGFSDRTTIASPNTVTHYHERMEGSDRITPHSDKTIGNTPKDPGASERTTSLSQITSSSQEGTGGLDRTRYFSPKITNTSHKNMESSFRTTSVSPETIITYHEGKGTSDRTTSVSFKITDTSQMETGISFRTHKGMGTSITGDLNKATGISNKIPVLTTIWTTAASDKITESLGNSYKSPFASDKIIGTMEPTTAMESLDKTITLGETSEKMTKSLEKTTDMHKTATSSHQPLGASDKSTQISDKTRKASEATGPLDKITHKSTSIPNYISTVPYPPFWVPSEKTFASFTTFNHDQELNSTKSVNNKWPNQKTDNSREGSQNGSIQGVLEGNSFPAWAIVIVVLVAVILLLLFIGLLIMAVYTIRLHHHHMATDYEKNDAEDEVGPNSYPVFLMEQQALGRSQIPLP